MSEAASTITDDDQERHMMPFPLPIPMSPPISRRILVIPNQFDIVRVLSVISMIQGHAIYILSGRGYISQGSSLRLPSPEPFIHAGRYEIIYVSGCFQPRNFAFDVPNRILYVRLSNNPQAFSIATRLIADGDFYLDVIFISGEGSIIQPQAPGGPREPIQLGIDYFNRR